MRRLLLLLLLLIPCAAQAQNARVDDIAFKGTNPVQFAAAATITVCTSAGTGTPCLPKVSGLCSSATDVTCNQPNPTTADSVGNFGFWIQPGSYVVTITGSGLTGYSKTFVLSCPLAGSCTFTGPLLCKNFEAIRCADQFPGATTDVQVNNAISDLPVQANGGGMGLVLIPSNSPASAFWNTTPNNAHIWDFRYLNDGGQIQGVFPFTHSHQNLIFNVGANDPYEANAFSGPAGLSIIGFANGGGTPGTTNAAAGVISFYTNVTRALASNRPVWGQATQLTTLSLATAANAAEFDVSNNHATLDDTAQILTGVHIVSGGTKRAGQALFINSSVSSDNWETAMLVANYHINGLQLQSADAARTADIYAVAPAGSPGQFFIGRDPTNATTVASISDLGKASFGGTNADATISKVFGTSDTTGNITQMLSSNVSGRTVCQQFTDSATFNTSACGDGATGDFVIYDGRFPANGGNERLRIKRTTGQISSSQFDAVYGTYRVTADFTLAANTSLQAITGLSWTMPANTALSVGFSCHLLYSQATAAVADQFGIQDVTVAPTSLMAKAQAYISASTFTAANLPALTTTTATPIVTFTPTAITTIWNADIDGMIEQPSNASTSVVQIMAQQSNSADLLTVKRGSFCRVW